MKKILFLTLFVFVFTSSAQFIAPWKTPVKRIYLDDNLKYISGLTYAACSEAISNATNYKNYGREILIFGDSHGWGQGSTDYDYPDAAYYGIHNAYPQNKGFNELIAEHIRFKFGFNEKVYGRVPALNSLMEVSNFATCGQNITKQESIIPINGKYYSKSVALNTLRPEWFIHAATYFDTAYREKIVQGQFDSSVVLKFGPDENGNCKFIIVPDFPARRTYFSVKATTVSGKLKVGWIDNNTSFFDTASKAVPLKYATKRTGYPKVFAVGSGIETDVTSYQTIDASGITMDLYGTNNLDGVYCIDWGTKQIGKQIFSYAGANASAGNDADLGTPCIPLRGIMFDNNYARNYSFGGHTLEAWLGTAASYWGETRNHVADVLSMCHYTPTLCIVQLPLVNEYISQTPIATFKASIDTLVARVNARFNVSGKKCDFIFFTTIGTKNVEFEGTISSAITYQMYSDAAKTTILAANAVFVDCRQMLHEMVRNNKIDYKLLYFDNGHPSSIANTWIADKVKIAIDNMM